MRSIRLEDRVLIVAPTGGGKSVLAHYITASLQPVRTIVVDPKAELELGVTPVYDPEEIPHAARAAVCHWIPQDCDRDTLEAGYAAIWAIPGPYVLWDDEIADTTTPSWAPRGKARLARMGRSQHKCDISCTQRLAECNPVVRTQATHIMVLTPAPSKLDMAKIAEYVNLAPDELETQLEALHASQGDYSHLWHVVPTRETRRMAAVPPPPYPWPPKRRRRQGGGSSAELEGAPEGSSACDYSDSRSGPR